MIEKPAQHMVLTVFIAAAGYHREAWRMPESRAEELGRFSLVKDMVRMAEAAKIDSVFFGDVSSGAIYRKQLMSSSGLNEPISLLSALAAVTDKIGLSGTVSTTFSYPYQTARQLSGVDNLSGGRCGWNIVTSYTGAENFGYEQLPPPEERYARAFEFVEACVQLWDSWSDDAVVVDRERGIWVEPDLMREINFEGEHYRVKGPFNMRRSPQGRPVLFQAGASPLGMKLGAKYAEGIYTAQTDMDASIQTMRTYEGLLAEVGRAPGSIKVLPGLLPIVGETRKDAEEYAAELAHYINWENGRDELSATLGFDLSDIDFDDRIPPERWETGVAQSTSFRENFRKRSVDEGYTLREMIIDVSRSAGHKWLVGTPSDIADHMVTWFEAGACSGFNLNPPSMPEGLERICKLLIPELQSRGYFREEYEGSTLRDHFGLPNPPAWDKQ